MAVEMGHVLICGAVDMGVAVEMGHVLKGGAVDMGGLIGISPAHPCHSSHSVAPPHRGSRYNLVSHVRIQRRRGSDTSPPVRQ